MTIPSRHLFVVALLASLLPIEKASADAAWPDLAQPAREVGGGKHDAAVVVGVEDYSYVPRVAGAKQNAEAWYDYFTHTRGIPVENVKLLTGVDATREEIVDALNNAATKTDAKSALWFVFIGHGVPSKDGKDGLLVGVDAQQKAGSLQARSLARSELLRTAANSKAASINVVLDACFSGRGQDGSSIAPGLQPLLVIPTARLDPRVVMLTAARGDQFAGSLPGTRRPAFSYLVLGGLRGWASKDGKRITAEDALAYARNALGATLRGRDQTPEIQGTGSSVMALSPGEQAPDLAALVKVTAGAKAELFKISNLPEVPEVNRPSSINPNVNSEDWRELDVESLRKYDAVVKIDKSDAPVEEKIRRWRELAKIAPRHAVEADARATQWERYAEEYAKTENLRQQRADARDKDWKKLSQLLALDIVSVTDKKRWAGLFVGAYGDNSEENPYVEDLVPYLPKGSIKVIPGAKENSRRRGKAGIEWITIEGGEFMMGSNVGDPDEGPVHSVNVPSFQLAKTEVTFGQYKKCIESGECGKLGCDDSYDMPVYCATWTQAVEFSRWVGGRLPSESEWEYAAIGGKVSYRYPRNCEQAVYGGCNHDGPMPVCSRKEGNTPQGLCDLAGNVREWTQDWYHSSYDRAPQDGMAWETPSGNLRVLRGGSWNAEPAQLRHTYREHGSPTSNPLALLTGKTRDRGFRPAKSN